MASKRSPLPVRCLAASFAAVGSLLLCTMGVSHAAQPAPPPALAGRAAAQRAAHARAMTRVTLVLKWVPQAQFAGYYVALKKGYYANEGLDVRIQPGGPDIVPESVVENGGATFGLDWLPSLLTQRDHGQDLVNVAQIFQTTGMRLIAFKSSGIKSPADFRGKKIGVWYSGNQYQFLAWMAKLGYNPAKDMTVIHQSFSMDLFLSHKLDLASAMTYNELGVVLESGVKLNQLVIFDYGKAGVSMLEDGIFARASYLKAHRDVAVRFLKASIMGWQDVVRDPVYAGRLAFSYSPAGASTLAHQIYMAREVVKLMWWGPARTHGIGYMDPVAFKRTAQLSLRYGLIHKMPTGAYDQSYWVQAVKELAAHHLLMRSGI
jgi:NitT/TauT family transport system substrate-binding protein